MRNETEKLIFFGRFIAFCKFSVTDINMTTFTKAAHMVADKYDVTVAAAVSKYNDTTEVHLDGDYPDCIVCIAHIIYSMYKDGNGKVSLKEIGEDLNTAVAAILEVVNDEN